MAKKTERIIVLLAKEELEQLQNIVDLSESSSTINPFDLNKVITTIDPKKEDNNIHIRNNIRRKNKKNKKWHLTTSGGLPPLINIIICIYL